MIVNGLSLQEIELSAMKNEYISPFPFWLKVFPSTHLIAADVPQFGISSHVYRSRMGQPGALGEYEPFCFIKCVLLTACLSRVIKSMMITSQIGLGATEMRREACSMVLVWTEMEAKFPTGGESVFKMRLTIKPYGAGVAQCLRCWTAVQKVPDTSPDTIGLPLLDPRARSFTSARIQIAQKRRIYLHAGVCLSADGASGT